jgi:hypothetical protein
MAGEIATAYVRIRANLAGLKQDIAAGVTGAFQGVGASTGGIAGAAGITAANEEVAASYKKVALDAVATGDVQKEVAESTTTVVNASAEERVRVAVAAAVAQVNANREIAASARSLAATLVAGSDEQRAAFTLAADADEENAARLRLAQDETKENIGGIASSLKGLVATVGLTFGAFQGFEFLKGVVTSAAQGQKALESVKADFGAFSGSILTFANGAARGLQISQTAAIGTASKFGLLFNQLGIGVKQGSTMTIEWEKLAGALSKIQGVPAAAALNAVTNAAEGNLKSLKSYGIVISAAEQKQALFQKGVIATTTQAITPAQKALANYLIATGRLPGLLDQAAKHSKDAADKTQQLAVDWSDAKSDIGDALLPAVQSLIGGLAGYLTKLEASGALQKDVNKVVTDAGNAFKFVWSTIGPVLGVLHTLVGDLGGVKHAMEIFFASIAVYKLAQFASGVQKYLIEQGMQALAKQAGVARTAYVADMGEMDVATVGLGATIKGALISTGIGALVVAVGIATVLIIDHWNTVKKWFDQFAAWLDANWRPVVIDVFSAIGLVVVAIIDHWNGVKRWFEKFASDFSELFTHPIAATRKLFSDLGTAIKGIFHAIWKSIEVDTLEALVKLLGYVDKFTGALAHATNGITSFLQIQGLTGKAGDPLTGLIASLNADLAAIKAAQAQLAPNGTSAGGVPHFQGKTFGGTAAQAAIQAKAKEAGDKLAAAVKANMKANAADEASLQETLDAERADRLANSLYNENIKQQITAAQNKVNEQIKSGQQMIANTVNSFDTYIDAGEAKLAGIATRVQQTQTNLQHYILNGTLGLQHTIAQNNQTLQNVVDEAQNNLNSISNKLQSLGAKLLKQKLAVGGEGGASLVGQLFRSLGGHDAAQLVHLADQTATAATANKGTSKLVSETVTQFQASVQKIFAEERHGRVGPSGLVSQLTALFRSQGLTGQDAAKLLGPQITDQITAYIKGAGTQFAQFLKATPAERAKANAATGEGLGPKIINVTQAITKAHYEDKLASTRYYNGLDTRLDAQKALLVEQRNENREFKAGLETRMTHLIQVEQDQNTKLTNDRLHLIYVTNKTTQEHAAHLLIEARKQTAWQQAISKDDASIAANTASLKSIKLGALPGFPTPTTRNPGHSADNAHNRAKVGA